MITLVQGTLFEKNPNAVTIICGGVGYKVFIPLNVYTTLPELNQDLLLYTYHIIREDLQALYGFNNIEERDLFENLLTVSGIGPKIALAMIGHLQADVIRSAIEEGNATLISKVPGIGKKTAQRVIVDLKDKAKKWDFGTEEKRYVTDAVAALLHLGYNPSQAQKAVQNFLLDNKDQEDLATIIRGALKRL